MRRITKGVLKDFLKKIASRRINGWLATLIIILAILIMPFVPSMWKHGQLARSFKAINHPPGTRLFYGFSCAGETTGGGHNYSYFVVQIRTYLGARKDIEKFYLTTRVFDPFTDSVVRTTGVDVLFPEKNKFDLSGFPYGYTELPEWFKVPEQKASHIKVYMVYVQAQDFSGFP